MFAEHKQLKSVWSITQDDRQRFWLGTHGLGLFEISDNQPIKRYTYNSQSNSGISGNNISVILTDKRSGTWVGTTAGLSYRAPQQQSFINIPTSTLAGQNEGENVRDVLEDPAGNIWVLTTRVLTQLNQQLKPVKRYSNQTTPAIHYNLWASTIYYHNDLLLVGSDSGLTVIDAKTEKSLKFFPLSGVARILADSQGALWVLAFEMLANMNALKSERISIEGYVERQSQRIGQLLRLTDRVLWGQTLVDPDLRTQPIDKILVQLAERYMMLAEERAFEFEWVIEPDIILHTDVRMVEEIVDNLLSNSFKYTRKGAVQLTINTQADQLMIRCQDTGIGIEPTLLDKIVQRNIRGDNHQDIQGTGIGLAIVDMFVRKLNGRLTFHRTK